MYYRLQYNSVSNEKESPLAETRGLREALRLNVVRERLVVVALLLEVRREEVAAGQIACLTADLDGLRAPT